jgi:hypothetical protein
LSRQTVLPARAGLAVAALRELAQSGEAILLLPGAQPHDPENQRTNGGAYY